MLTTLILHTLLLTSQPAPKIDDQIVDCFVAGHTSNRLDADFDTMVDGQRYCITVPSDNFDF